MRHLPKAVILLPALLLTACAPVSPYQRRGVELPLKDAVPLEDVERKHDLQLDLEARSIESYGDPPFTLGVIELTDDGLLNPSQHKQVLDMVRTELADPRGALLVVFAHGWHHGCSTCDRDIACFRRVLGRLAAAEKNQRNRRVVGIFLGWRGRHFRGRKDVLSIWNRKAAAEHIGKTGAKEVLSELHAEWAKYQQQAMPGPKRVTMVSIGHSLGGVMLYWAVKEQLSGSVSDIFRGKDGALRAVRTAEPRSGVRGKKAVRSRFGDLVVLVNPALEASAYFVFDYDLRDEKYAEMTQQELIDRNQPPDKNLPYSDGQLPVLVTVASRADSAVGQIFPMSRVMSGFVHYSMGRVFTRPAYRRGLGHYEPQVTHVLSYNGPEPMELANGNCSCRMRWTTATPVALRKTEQMIQTSQGTGAEMSFRLAPHRDCSGGNGCRGWDPRSPYFVIRTDETVIANHNDIFNPVLVGFLTSFIRSFEESKYDPARPAQAY